MFSWLIGYKDLKGRRHDTERQRLEANEQILRDRESSERAVEGVKDIAGVFGECVGRFGLGGGLLMFICLFTTAILLLVMIFASGYRLQILGCIAALLAVIALLFYLCEKFRTVMNLVIFLALFIGIGLWIAS